MKSNKATQNKGLISRLFEESLILSCLGFISSRLVSFFKASVLSYILTGGETSDNALDRSGIARTAQRFKLKTKVSRNIKTRFSLSIENSVISNKYKEILQRVIYTPVSSFGAFFATLGIYICLVYFVKLYGFETEDTKRITSLATGEVIIAASLPLLFCRKSLVNALSESAFIRSMLSGVIDLDAYQGEKRQSAVGIALIIGSVLGVLTFFCGETKILLLVLAVICLLLVFHSPELGLLSSAMIFPFCGKNLLCAIITAALFSYIVKLLRGKRNLRLHTANIFVLLLGLCFLFALLGGGGGNAWFAMCMAALYLLAANLFNTKSLLNKCSSALTLGLGIAAVVYAAQVFIAAIGGGSWQTALLSSSSVFGTGKQFSCYLLLVMPFVFCNVNRFFSRIYSFLLVIACILYSVLNGNTVCAILAAAAASLSLAVQGRRIFRPFLLYFGVPVGVLYFSNVSIRFEDMGFYNMLSGWSAAFKAGGSNFFTGAGMSDRSVSLALEGNSHSMYLQTFVECGAFGFILLLLAIGFALQRVYARLSEVGSANRNITAAAGASAVVGLIIGMGTNLWSDKNVCFIFWLCLGLACATYEIRKEQRRGTEDERNW